MDAEITKDGDFKYNIKLNIELYPYSNNEDTIEMILDYVKQSLLKQYKEDLIENGFKD